MPAVRVCGGWRRAMSDDVMVYGFAVLCVLAVAMGLGSCGWCLTHADDLRCVGFFAGHR